ncbi:intradiol ring-cleavage dioxygenase [Flectobacillus sp. DC10W]|uniref:Intradiol ring-cleavage dioxygenase n=1 Tax=Flectobacillus longus TaxID=2984207 RepID=A0ABT6YQL0_9BACT|nr:intradiol ring-cleavage dioxygenase [Flectobacillus longus]MDI9865879.1 intradiol ring-cleavage dioxygenase [Flectobacillus longus]
MKRIDFLKRAGLGLVTAQIVACKTESVDPTSSSNSSSSSSTTTSGSTNTSCTSTPSETEGPFPTKTPSSLVQNNITSDRSGTKLTVKINIQNKNASCAGLANAIVDIWHCDAAGNYSEYGGTGMQSTNYTTVHFLRGRQVTDSTGLVTFTSIYPGWYSGRATHIHVHVYNSAGTSLLVTQIAFPEDISKIVYAQGVYASHGQADTTNTKDNVFGDGVTYEMSTVTGNTTDGYVLTHNIVVSA